MHMATEEFERFKLFSLRPSYSAPGLHAAALRLVSRAFAAAVLVALCLSFAGGALAEHHKVALLNATVCTDDPSVQHVRVRLDDVGENLWANCIEFRSLNASSTQVSSFVVPNNVPNGDGVVVDIGTAEFGAATGTVLDVVIPSGNVMDPNGRVCYHGRSNLSSCKGIDLCVNVTPTTCGSAVCGNGVVEAGEQCDDGGTQPGDCCSATCQFEAATTQCRPSAGSCDVAEFCSGTSGSCPVNEFDPGLCDDGSFCTVGRACVAGSCTDGSPRDCSASGDQCNSGVCNEVTDTCEPQPANQGGVCSDGNAATVGDVCSAGTCAGVDLCAGVVCGGADQCHAAGTCDPQTGACSNPVSLEGVACDDGDASTVGDVCSAGTCAGVDLCAGVVCTAADACHEAGTCNPQTGACSNPASPDGTACDDGDATTAGDVCSAGICTAVIDPANEPIAGNDELDDVDDGEAPDFDIPTEADPSPLFGVRPFTQKMFRFEEFGIEPYEASDCPDCGRLPPAVDCETGPVGSALDHFLEEEMSPIPSYYANESETNAWHARISQCVRPLQTSAIEGRPGGEDFAHQRWEEFAPTRYFKTATAGARDNGGIRDEYQRHAYARGEFGPGGLYHNTLGAPGFEGTTRGVSVRFHPDMPIQDPRAVWTFDGTFPPKLLMASYGEPILFRHYNALPIDPAANYGFGLHTLSTHEHNGHNPAESDGYAQAFFFPGQYFDYHWPMILAGHDSINREAADPRAATIDDDGNARRIPGDWRETMSTHWFHDHMLDFTAPNVYKGSAAMMNYYSALDRGNESVDCHYANPANVNLCLPSGSESAWGNRDYDINLMVADKAWDADGQLFFNIFNLDGFMGDRMTVNWLYKPYLEVRARRYRFRILNGSVSRYLKLALVDQRGDRVPYHMVANDGNIMEHAVPFPNDESFDLPTQAVAERYDIVVDFSRFREGDRLYLVNLLQHEDGKGPDRAVSLQKIVRNEYCQANLPADDDASAAGDDVDSSRGGRASGRRASGRNRAEALLRRRSGNDRRRAEATSALEHASRQLEDAARQREDADRQREDALRQRDEAARQREEAWQQRRDRPGRRPAPPAPQPEDEVVEHPPAPMDSCTSALGDPGVGKFLEFRVVAYDGVDTSMNPADYVEGKKKMIPLPGFSAEELANARHRTFEFGRDDGTDSAPWTIKTDGGFGYDMDPARLSAAPDEGSVEIWHLENGGGGWSHPIHIHFEEGQILSRDGKEPPIWEKWARKDVYRVGSMPDSGRTIDVALRFREFLGTYMEHCHNTQHEDHAMLLRWDIENPGQLAVMPTPMPTWEGVGYIDTYTLPTYKAGDLNWQDRDDDDDDHQAPSEAADQDEDENPEQALAEDRDGDGVPDRHDNCRERPNPDQRDSDHDGYGNRCDPDFDNDGIVDAEDFGRFQQHWGSADPASDLNGDGIVNVSDFMILFGHLSGPPGPGASL